MSGPSSTMTPPPWRTHATSRSASTGVGTRPSSSTIRSLRAAAATAACKEPPPLENPSTSTAARRPVTDGSDAVADSPAVTSQIRLTDNLPPPSVAARHAGRAAAALKARSISIRSSTGHCHHDRRPFRAARRRMASGPKATCGSRRRAHQAITSGSTTASSQMSSVGSVKRIPKPAVVASRVVITCPCQQIVPLPAARQWPLP